MTYERLAVVAALSPATLKRAAGGSAVPRRATVEAYIEGCGGTPEAVRAAEEMWRQARIEERGRLTQLHAPRPELISDEADLSRALEVVFEQAGAPSLREIRTRSGNPLALPVSSAARIVNRDAVPADEQQMQAFLTGCGLPPEQHAPWLTAFRRTTSRLVGDSVFGAARSWTRQELNALLSSMSEAQDAHTHRRAHPDPLAVRNRIVTEAVRNGYTAGQVRSWQPDLLTYHDGTYVAIEVKSTAHPKRRPPEGNGTPDRRRPPGGIDPTAPSTARHRPVRGPHKFAILSRTEPAAAYKPTRPGRITL